MTKLKSQIKINDPDFLKNKKKLIIDLKLTQEAVDFAMDGGGQTLNDRHQKRGKMLPRHRVCLLYTSPSPRDGLLSRMPSSA